MTDLIPANGSQNQLQRQLAESEDRFEKLVSMALSNKSQSTQEMYRRTYEKWKAWCADRRLHPMHLQHDTLQAFIESGDTTKATRQREKSAMKQLLALLLVVFPDNRDLKMEYALFSDWYKPRGKTGKGKERKPYALSTEQVMTVRDYWRKENDGYHLRNYAMIALMFASGLRADEVVNLQWNDINLDTGVVHVRHGKGDKERYAAIYGNIALDALRSLKKALPGFAWVFTPFAPYTHESQGDAPIVYRTLKQVIEKTAEKTQVSFTPHDARHTLLTEVIQASDLVEAQAQAGHSDGSTTMRYGHASDAKTRRNKTRISYG